MISMDMHHKHPPYRYVNSSPTPYNISFSISPQSESRGGSTLLWSSDWSVQAAPSAYQSASLAPVIPFKRKTVPDPNLHSRPPRVILNPVGPIQRPSRNEFNPDNKAHSPPTMQLKESCWSPRRVPPGPRAPPECNFYQDNRKVVGYGRPSKCVRPPVVTIKPTRFPTLEDLKKKYQRAPKLPSPLRQCTDSSNEGRSEDDIFIWNAFRTAASTRGRIFYPRDISACRKGECFDPFLDSASQRCRYCISELSGIVKAYLRAYQYKNMMATVPKQKRGY